MVLLSLAAMVCCLAAFVWLHLPDSQPPTFPRHIIDDVAMMHPTRVDSLFTIVSEQEIGDAIRYAQSKGLRISIAGRRHSMGGHTLTPQGVTLLMTEFNDVLSFDSASQTVTVQSGITWDTLQAYLNQIGYAVMSMQGPNIFTVGGSMSVNAHGWAKFKEQVGESIVSFRLVLADGTIATCSPFENVELFKLAIGGFGLFGVISDVTLRVVENDMLARSIRQVRVTDIEKIFRSEYELDSSSVFFHADLSIAPSSLLQEGTFSIFQRLPFGTDSISVTIQPENNVNRDRFFLHLSRQYDWGKELRWWLQKKLVRGDTLSRNNTMHSPYQRLQYYSPENADILQEYFVPSGRVVSFSDKLREIVSSSKANLINCTVRSIRKSEVPFLNYAKQEGFGFVLYLNVRKDSTGRAADSLLTSKLIDACLSDSGTFYLPYLPFYSAKQLRTAYPEIDEFIRLKIQYDPNELFGSLFYERLKALLH